MMGWFDRILRKSASSDAAPAMPAERPVVTKESPLHKAAAVPAAPEDSVARSAALTRQGVAMLDQGKLLAAEDLFRQALALDPGNVGRHINLAFALQGRGADKDSLPHLRFAVEAEPDNFDAHYLLGGTLERLGDHATAATHLSRAVALNPSFIDARLDLCRVLAADKRSEEAREVIEAAIAVAPGHVDLHRYRGNLCLDREDLEGAIESYNRTLALAPQDASTHSNLGVALRRSGRMEQAIESFRRAVTLQVGHAVAHLNLGMALEATGQLDDATSALEQSLVHDPKSTEALVHLGQVLDRRGRVDEAIATYRRALAIRPDDASALSNLGFSLFKAGDVEGAMKCYRQALGIRPDAETQNRLGIALRKAGRLEAAVDALREALRLNPDHVHALSNLGALQTDFGDGPDAVASFRRVVELSPKHLVARSNLLFTLSHQLWSDPGQYLREVREFGAVVAESARPYSDWPACRRDGEEGPSRPLRVGLVSGDLRTHPVGFFAEGVLSRLDPAKVELVAYTTTVDEDSVTARLKTSFSSWRSLVGLGDEAAARLIRDDGIDVLIDLAGHSADNRLAVFAWRPAPLQLTWLGYFASTGVEAIDYLIADPVGVPPKHEEHYTERIWRLPDTRLCFTAPGSGSALPLVPPPALRRGYVTFGSFQSLVKLNERVLEVWSRVLASVPRSRLILQSRQLADETLCRMTLERLVQAGIVSDRVELRRPTGRGAYLAAHEDIDLILDTFPYTGGTTTCESLWMGVPTVTLDGSTLLARQGASLLSCAGLEDWIAPDEDAYVARAVAAANDLDGLAALRMRLRDQVLASPLFHPDRFARHLEDALEAMWRETGLPRLYGPVMTAARER